MHQWTCSLGETVKARALKRRHAITSSQRNGSDDTSGYSRPSPPASNSLKLCRMFSIEHPLQKVLYRTYPQRRGVAGERKALEKETRWRKKSAGEKEGPEKRKRQRNILERKGLFGVLGSRNGFLVCARLIPPEWLHLQAAVCLGHLSWAYLACQEISPQHPPPTGTTLLSVPLSSADIPPQRLSSQGLGPRPFSSQQLCPRLFFF